MLALSVREGPVLFGFVQVQSFCRWGFPASRREKSPKQKINRQPAGDQNQSRQSRRSPITQQDHQNYAGPHNVKRRHNRITERLVRTFRQRLQPPQTKDSNNRQNVKNQNSGDNVVEQIAIKVPIFPADRIVSPRQNQKRRPQALHQQRDSRHSRAIQNPSALKKVHRAPSRSKRENP